MTDQTQENSKKEFDPSQPINIKHSYLKRNYREVADVSITLPSDEIWIDYIKTVGTRKVNITRGKDESIIDFDQIDDSMKINVFDACAKSSNELPPKEKLIVANNTIFDVSAEIPELTPLDSDLPRDNEIRVDVSFTVSGVDYVTKIFFFEPSSQDEADYTKATRNPSIIQSNDKKKKKEQVFQTKTDAEKLYKMVYGDTSSKTAKSNRLLSRSIGYKNDEIPFLHVKLALDELFDTDELGN